MLSSQSIIIILLMRNGASQRNLKMVEVMIDTHMRLKVILFISFCYNFFTMAILRPTNSMCVFYSSIPQSLLESIQVLFYVECCWR